MVMSRLPTCPDEHVLSMYREVLWCHDWVFALLATVSEELYRRGIEPPRVD
ncbi:MAG TPA: hypothetical protein VNP04_19635 [Alphaproteobacteria bacterium]|nr:hypothetical protein [Alphaproteobacteria bacterium]